MRSGWLDRERIVAAPGFNRWLVPPAALAMHLCIGQAYSYSVFKLPLTRAGDWSQTQIAAVFTLFIVVLGLSAAVFGRWVERAGPRKAGLVAALCWGGGFLIAALGVRLHALGLVYLGNGVLGGCGLGLGYISPVSTLIKWFPDRRGLATGMAIMGFGGGALIGAPLADLLMRRFAVAETFAVFGLLDLVVMLCAAFAYRLPPPDWQPLTTRHDAEAHEAWRTPQFWLLWVVLCANVTAGIGVLEQASPMIQEVFKGKVTASAAAGFVGLLSLFNIAGRIAWASLSDRIGRKPTYTIFFALGILFYAAVPAAGGSGSVALFAGLFCVILSMYGGGFATIPAYLSDLFGVRYVGAIHGRLLTAWSVAGVVGPLLVNAIRQSRIDAGMPPQAAYDRTMYLLAALLVAGLAANLAVRPPGAARFRSGGVTTTMAPSPAGFESGRWVEVAIGWALVGAPLAWGITMSLQKAALLFR